jgi:hypothetical protein
MKPDTHTDEYLYGYADAIDNAMNLQAFTKSKEYQKGYIDALHDTEFSHLQEDTF